MSWLHRGANVFNILQRRFNIYLLTSRAEGEWLTLLFGRNKNPVNRQVGLRRIFFKGKIFIRCP